MNENTEILLHSRAQSLIAEADGLETVTMITNSLDTDADTNLVQAASLADTRTVAQESPQMQPDSWALPELALDMPISVAAASNQASPKIPAAVNFHLPDDSHQEREAKPRSRQSTEASRMRVISSIPPSQSPQQRVQWEQTLIHAIKAIVAIRVTQTRPFDTEKTGSYCGTGFVVGDGLLLSNRHIVSAGPVVAKGTFADYEEITVWPCYRDPVHDFGFFRFDASNVKFFECEKLVLNPDGAKVGTDVRVVGNDAGEKLSILQGTMARLDRPAPFYGFGKYTDFNTFYLQAASSTSGGSSGSPVLNMKGEVIALNAGASSQSSQSYFLPLYRVKRALEKLNQGLPITRGTIQTEFGIIPFEEARRMGLKDEIELQLRSGSAECSGVLVVRSIVPKGPADGILEEGDFLLRINGKLIFCFVDLESFLDESCEQFLQLEIQRADRLFTVEVKVQDLHSITPDRYVEFGDGIVHELSYMMAKSFGYQARGVFVACAGYKFANAGISSKCVILSVDNYKTPSLSDFIAIVSSIPSFKRVVVKYILLGHNSKVRTTTLVVDRQYFPFNLAVRNDATGVWDYQSIETPDKNRRARLLPSVPSECTFDDATFFDTYSKDPNISRTVGAICASAVHIECHVPYLIEGTSMSMYSGLGVIVDPHLGLVVCDRSVVPIATCTIEICLPNNCTIPGRIVYMHSKYPFVFISYPVQAGLNRSAPMLEWWDGHHQDGSAQEASSPNGMPVYCVTFPEVNNVPNIRKTCVSSNFAKQVALGYPPRFRPISLELMNLENIPSAPGLIITADSGKICGFWSSVMGPDGERLWMAVPSFSVHAILTRLRMFASRGNSCRALGPAPPDNVRRSGIAPPQSTPSPSQGQSASVHFRQPSPGPSSLRQQSPGPGSIDYRLPSPAPSNVGYRQGSPAPSAVGYRQGSPAPSTVGYRQGSPALSSLGYRQGSPAPSASGYIQPSPGIPTTYKHYVDGLHHLEAEVVLISLSESKKLGVPLHWINMLGRNNMQKTVLQVQSVFHTTPIVSLLSKDGTRVTSRLEEGDIILTINGATITRLAELSAMEYDCDVHNIWEVVVWRDGLEEFVLTALKFTPFLKQIGRVPVGPLDFHIGLPIVPVCECIGWCGLILQEPYLDAIRQTSATLPDCLPPELRQVLLETDAVLIGPDVWRKFPYISCVMKGSPGETSGLTSGFYVLRVGAEWTYNTSETNGSFVDLLARAMNVARSGNGHIRLQIMSRSGIKKVLSVFPDEHYWPTWTLVADDNGQGQVDYPFKAQ